MEKLLFVASEAYPLIKTGGLADVAGSLPEVLRQQGMDVRLLLPGYQRILESIEPPAEVARFDVGGATVRILATRLPGTELETWLLEHPLFRQKLFLFMRLLWGGTGGTGIYSKEYKYIM